MPNRCLVVVRVACNLWWKVSQLLWWPSEMNAFQFNVGMKITGQPCWTQGGLTVPGLCHPFPSRMHWVKMSASSGLSVCTVPVSSVSAGCYLSNCVSASITLRQVGTSVHSGYAPSFQKSAGCRAPSGVHWPLCQPFPHISTNAGPDVLSCSSRVFRLNHMESWKSILCPLAHFPVWPEISPRKLKRIY